MRPSASTLLVWTGAPCAHACPTCPIDASAEAAGIDSGALQQLLQAVAQVEGRLVVLVGGEPLLRPDTLRLLATVRAAGAVPGLVTTGIGFSSKSTREKLRRLGVGYVRVQLFGSGEGHDAATVRPGCYVALIAALRDWLGETGSHCDVDVALHPRGRSASSLAGDVERIAADIDDAGFQMIVGGESIDPGALHGAMARLDHWNDLPNRPLLVWEGVGERESPAACATVASMGRAFLGPTPRASCLGATSALAKALPPLAPRSNSFNFLRTANVVVRVDAPEDCAAHAAGDATARDRQLWHVEAEQVVLYATDTGDFDANAVARIKDEWSHLFVDRAAPGVLDDFTEGMRRVLPDPLCFGCDKRESCARRFVTADGPPFAREEEWIADYVRRLRGRVLDVGCGEQLYRDEIVPLVRSGAISYTGLDPDRISLDDWRAVLPEGRFVLGGIEDYVAAPGSYDRVLCLRSLNHVFDLDEAMARMAALLRPGGQLLIVETTPFAMLRTAEQVAAADRAPRAGHQHYRNVTSEDVLPYARRRNLRVEHHHPVGLDTTNEWILLLSAPLFDHSG